MPKNLTVLARSRGGCSISTSASTQVVLIKLVRQQHPCHIDHMLMRWLFSKFSPVFRSVVDGWCLEMAKTFFFWLTTTYMEQIVYACLSNTLLLTVLVSVRIQFHSLKLTIRTLRLFIRFYPTPSQPSVLTLMQR